MVDTPIGHDHFVLPADSAWELMSDQRLIASRREVALPDLICSAPRGCSELEFVFMGPQLPLVGAVLPVLSRSV